MTIRRYLKTVLGAALSIGLLCQGLPARADGQEAPPGYAPPPAPPGEQPAPAPPAVQAPAPPLYAPPPVYYYPPPVAQRVPIRYEERPRTGLAIAGGATLGGVYLLSVLFTATIDGFCNGVNCNQDWPMYIPVVGPFIEAGRFTGDSRGLIPLVVLDGLAQTSGLVMLIAGLATRHRVPVYAERAQLLPYAAPGGGGLLAVGRF